MQTCGLPLLPDDQVRVLGYQATLCFHRAMTALNLEALGPNVRIDVSLELLSRLGTASCTTRQGGSCWPTGAWRGNDRSQQ